MRQSQSPGDILTMTRAVADLKNTYPEYLIDVRTPCPEIWENNPHLTRLEDADPEVEKYDITYDEINQSGFTGEHFMDAFRHDIEKKLGVQVIRYGNSPELWVSDLERTWINQVEVEFGWKGPFWILNAGWKPDNELKWYPRWQEVVDLWNDYFKGTVRICQIGSAAHQHPPLRGVYSLVGKTDLRQLIRLGWWAHGSLGPLSFQFVMSAALRQPHVVVAGGKEGVRWHLYPHGRFVHTNGALKCCLWDGCWKGGKKGLCVDLLDEVPRCFRLIEPYMIVDAVKMYYQGGVLGLDRGK